MYVSKQHLEHCTDLPYVGERPVQKKTQKGFKSRSPQDRVNTLPHSKWHFSKEKQMRHADFSLNSQPNQNIKHPVAAELNMRVIKIIKKNIQL